MKKSLLLISFGVLSGFWSIGLGNNQMPDYRQTVSTDKVWQYYGYGDAYTFLYGHYARFDGTLNLLDNVYSRFCIFKTCKYSSEDGMDNKEINTLIEEYERNATLGYMREESGKVYELFYNGSPLTDPEGVTDASLLSEQKVYDWSLPQGATWDYYASGETVPFTVEYLEPVEIGGRECKTQVLVDDVYPAAAAVRLIEGIGVNENGSLANVNLVTLTGAGNNQECPSYGSWLGCVTGTDGEVIYKTGFYLPNLGVGNISDDACGKADGKIYNLMGREVKEMIPGTIYIRNGKKIFRDH